MKQAIWDKFLNRFNRAETRELLIYIDSAGKDNDFTVCTLGV